MFLILRTIDAALYKEENEYHWTICALNPPDWKYEGSVLQNLHREVAKLKSAKDKLIDLFEQQYERHS